MRTLQRVMFGTAILTGVALAAAPGLAQAQQKFPSKPIRLVVGFPPGSGSDTLARLIGQKMSEGWGQAVVVDNRTGAGGALAGGMVAKGIADGGAGSARIAAWMRPGSDP